MTDTTHSAGAVRAGNAVCKFIYGDDSSDWPKSQVIEIIERETKCRKMEKALEFISTHPAHIQSSEIARKALASEGKENSNE